MRHRATGENECECQPEVLAERRLAYHFKKKDSRSPVASGQRRAHAGTEELWSRLFRTPFVVSRDQWERDLWPLAAFANVVLAGEEGVIE